MKARNLREFRNWLKGIPFPRGGEQGEGARPLWWPVPKSIEALSCGCIRGRELKVQTTYHKEVLCGTCRKFIN